ncbi:hypothetical protein OIU76_001611 [Salix suchowensis]|nr:hypothetical protein OIU76_001611 [Salix suchowensis]
MIPRKQREETFDTSSEQRKAETSRRSRREEGKFKTIPDWTRLSTDSASRCNPAHAGAGRLVRDALHRFIMGSEAGVGYGNVLKDESWVVKIDMRDLAITIPQQDRRCKLFIQKKCLRILWPPDDNIVDRIRNRISEQILMMYSISADFEAFENQECYQRMNFPIVYKGLQVMLVKCPAFLTGDCSLVDRQSSQVAGGFNGGAVAIQRWKLQVLTEGAHPHMCLINHSWEYFLDKGSVQGTVGRWCSSKTTEDER